MGRNFFQKIGDIFTGGPDYKEPTSEEIAAKNKALLNAGRDAGLIHDVDATAGNSLDGVAKAGRRGAMAATGGNHYAQTAASGLQYASLRAAKEPLWLMRQRANGQDSVVRRQAAVQRDALARQIASRAASGRGNTRASSQRAALMATGQLGSQMAGQTAAAAAGERQAAQNSYLAALQRQRAQDIGVLNAATQDRASVRSFNLGQLGLAQKYDQGSQQFQLARQQLMLRDAANKQRFVGGQHAQGNAERAQFESQNANLLDKAIGMAGSAISAYAASSAKKNDGGAEAEGSDRRAKEDIAPADRDMDEFLQHLQAQRWKYKDPDRFGDGERVGVMAQELERSRLGRQLVSEDDDGTKLVNYDSRRFSPLVLAALAHLHDRIEDLES